MRYLARGLSILALVLSVAAFGNAADAANPLLCFDGPSEGTIYGGDCVLNSASTAAHLDTADGDPDGSYAGVYYAVSSLSGKSLDEVTDVSFKYTCDSATTNCVSGGSPRLSIPIDTDGNGTWNSYAFIDAANCGLTGVISGTVNLNCPVFFGGVLYDNWADFADANPTYTIATNAVSFVIADQPFEGTISDVHLGAKATFASTKDECKDGGWKTLTRADDSAFKNQGDCIQYANTGK